MTSLLPRPNVHTRATFVRSSVKETPVTAHIIDTIMPYFPARCRCIAGYLDESDQFWKVNYHWDLLVFMIDKFLAMRTVPAELLAAARAIRKALLTNPPDPKRGYRNDRRPGATKDRSTREMIIKRHAILKRAKRDFEVVLLKARIIRAATKKGPAPKERPWWLAVAPVAAPGGSKHGTGYALDIEGDNAETTRIVNFLGATLVFNEASHVHVEWQYGVHALV